LCSWTQSNQVAAPTARPIVNYGLTCGLSASVFSPCCTEKRQGADSNGTGVPCVGAKLLCGNE
jgi:hypothetical protein